MLSSTLFLVAINDILRKLGSGVDGSLFADDLAIYITTRNQRVATRTLQVVTNKLDAWVTKRGLTFSSNKTVSMIFRKRNEKPIKIILRNEIIPLKKSTHFLGMTLDIRLNWEQHINKLRAKVRSALNTIKVVAEMKWGGDLKDPKNPYSAICRTKIDYGCQIYNAASAGILKELDHIHR